MAAPVLPEDLEGEVEVDDEVDAEEDVGGERGGRGADAAAQEEGVEQVHDVVADESRRRGILAGSAAACKQKCGTVAEKNGSQGFNYCLHPVITRRRW